MATAIHTRDLTENLPSEGERRLAGVAGVAFFGWLLVAAVTYAGLIPQPAFSDPDAYHIRYFAGNGTALALHAWFSGVFWVLCFMTFAAGLRRHLASGAPAAGMWAGLAFYGALLAIAAGGIGVAIEIAATAVPGNVAPTIAPVLGRLLAVVYETVLYWGLGLYVGAGSIAILRSGRFTPGLAWLGFADFALLFIGSAWPITADDRGLLGLMGLLGLFLAGVWTLWAAILLLRAPADSSPPGTADPALRDGSSVA